VLDGLLRACESTLFVVAELDSAILGLSHLLLASLLRLLDFITAFRGLGWTEDLGILILNLLDGFICLLASLLVAQSVQRVLLRLAKLMAILESGDKSTIFVRENVVRVDLHGAHGPLRLMVLRNLSQLIFYNRLRLLDLRLATNHLGDVHSISKGD